MGSAVHGLVTVLLTLGEKFRRRPTWEEYSTNPECLGAMTFWLWGHGDSMESGYMELTLFRGRQSTDTYCQVAISSRRNNKVRD